MLQVHLPAERHPPLPGPGVHTRPPPPHDGTVPPPHRRGHRPARAELQLPLQQQNLPRSRLQLPHVLYSPGQGAARL